MGASIIRTARKAGKCAEYRFCGNMIAVGDKYIEGDIDPYKAGGFGRERLCLKCGSEYQVWITEQEARAFAQAQAQALAQARGEA